MVEHARLIVSGNVQGVGYRTLAKQIAKRMRVTGIIRNLDDGNVEIYCQCSDKETLDKFIERIDVKATTDNVFAVHVDSIDSYREDEVDYGEPDTDFKTFVIDYGMEVDQFQRESLERSEIGILLLGGTISGIGNVHSEVGGTRNDIKSMHGDLKEETIKTHEKLGSIDHRLDDALTRYDLFGKEITVIGDMKLLASEFREFKDLFAIYVKHQLDKDSE